MKLVTSTCYAENYSKTQERQITDYNNLAYLEYKRKRIAREALIRKKEQMVLRSLLAMTLISVAGFVIVYNLVYNHIYLPLKNQNLILTVTPEFLHPTESLFNNINTLGNSYLFNEPVAEMIPLMKSLPLRNELTDLKEQLLPFLSSDPNYKAGIFIWDAQSGDYVSINGNEAFPTASIIKIPVLIELFRQIDQGIISSLDEELESNLYHLAGGSGELQFKPLGQKYSLDYLASVMIENSDNTATNLLLDKVGGMGILNNIMKVWGIKNGEMNNWLPDLSGTNVMSPKDYTTMLYNIENPAFLSPKSSSKILEYMSNIKHRNLINSGLPAGSKLAHKTGDIGEMVGDAGIVTLADGRKIIMVAMVTRPWNSYKAKDMIREASRVTFNYFSNHNQI